jgi:hypothetical protein
MKKLLFLFVLSSVTSFVYAQAGKDCSIMKEGSFRYLDTDDTTSYFIIKGKDHSEYHNSEKYSIKSEIKWTSDCQYKMVMLSHTFPDFAFGPGDEMTVTITDIKGDIIYYTSEVRGHKWNGRLRKIK